MAHFAKVENGIVTDVQVAEQDVIDSGFLGDPSLWIQTSYNTRGGVHYQPNSDVPSEDQSKALRANYASIGYIYDAVNNVFHPPRPLDKNGNPCNSWTISAPTWLWLPPVAEPYDEHIYLWDEPTLSWVVFI